MLAENCNQLRFIFLVVARLPQPELNVIKNTAALTSLLNIPQNARRMLQQMRSCARAFTPQCITDIDVIYSTRWR